MTGNDSRGARRQRAPGPTRWSAAVGPPGRACGTAHAQPGLGRGGAGLLPLHNFREQTTQEGVSAK